MKVKLVMKVKLTVRHKSVNVVFYLLFRAVFYQLGLRYFINHLLAVSEINVYFEKKKTG